MMDLGYRWIQFHDKQVTDRVESAVSPKVLKRMIAESEVFPSAMFVIGRFLQDILEPADAFLSKEAWYVVYNGKILCLEGKETKYSPESGLANIAIIYEQSREKALREYFVFRSGQ